MELETFEQAELRDKILLKFEGDKTWTWEAINIGRWKDIDPSIYVITNEIKHLLGINVLQRVNWEGLPSVQMSDKGYALFADRANNGFVVSLLRELRKREEKEIEERRNKRIQKWILVFTVIGVIATIAGICFALYDIHIRK